MPDWLIHLEHLFIVVLVFLVIIFHLFALVFIEAYMVTLNNIVPSFMTIFAVPYIRIKELVSNERVAT